jgi:hypothetical protein
MRDYASLLVAVPADKFIRCDSIGGKERKSALVDGTSVWTEGVMELSRSSLHEAIFSVFSLPWLPVTKPCRRS